jgi:putative oxidoreductase
MIAATIAFVGRLFIALLFVVEGANKLLQSGEARTEFAAASVSPELAVPIGIAQLVLGLMLALGAWTRVVALVLAILMVGETLFFYSAFTDAAVSAIALRNIAIIGGLLSLFAYGQARWGYDALRERRRAELAERDTQLRHSEAQRAEAEAERNRAVRDLAHPERPVFPDRTPPP